MKTPGVSFRHVAVLVCCLFPLVNACATGFLVLKAPNGQPEFAKVIPFVRIEPYAAHVVITTYDKIDRPISRAQIITYLEIDETPLRGNLVTEQDFARVERILSEIESLAEVHPKMNDAGEPLISAIRQVLAAREEGRVKYWGQWMSKAEYTAKLEEEKALALEKQERMAAAEEERMRLALEEERKRAETMKMAAAEEERRLREAAMKAEQMRFDAEAREREERKANLAANLTGMAKQFGGLFAARWDQIRIRPKDADVGGLPLPTFIIDALSEEFFPSVPVELPLVGPPGIQATARESRDGSRCLVVFSDGSTGGAVAAVLTATLEYNDSELPAGNEDTRTWGQIAQVLDQEGAEKLALGISTLLTMRLSAGSTASAVSLGLEGIRGWLELGEPKRSTDGRVLGSMIIGLGAIGFE